MVQKGVELRVQNSLQILFREGATQVSLSQAVEAFLRAEMIGKSEATVIWYRRRLGLMIEILGSERILADLIEVDLLEWYNCLDHRERRYVGSVSRPEVEGGLSVETKHGYVRACKRFFKWLARKGILTVDLSQDLQLPKLPRKRGKKGVTDGNAQAIIEAARENVRDYALIRFIESTGIRRGGAAHLLLSDLNLDSTVEAIRRRATVCEKGNKRRTVVMTKAALAALEAWLEERSAIDDEHVFLGQKWNEPWKPLSEEGVSGIYRRYKERLGIQGRVSPHQWRHRWCRKLLHKGMGLKKVSQLAGHEDIGVTDMFYSDFDMDELQETFDQCADDFDYE